MSTSIPKTSGLVTLRYIVMSALNRLNEYSLKNYKRYMQMCIEEFSESLALFHVGHSAEVVYLHMSAAKIVNLPADYVDYLKIGIPINGKLKVITKHNGLSLPRVFDDTGEAIGHTTLTPADETLNPVFFSDHFRGGQWVGGMYGLPGGVDSAYFRIDMENRQIIFHGSTTRSEIVLEYLSSGLRPEGGSLIPRECVAPLRNYILWQRIENDPRVPQREKDRREDQYEKSIEALRSFSNMFTKEEYLHVIYSTARQSPRR